MPDTTIMWFRRDLRVHDLAALDAASAVGAVVPLFVVDPVLMASSGAPRAAYLHDCLAALDGSLGGRLVVRHGDPVAVVPAVAAEVDAEIVHVTRDHAPFGRRRDAAVAEALRSAERRLRGVGSNYAVEPGTVRKDDDSPYAVFTPFAKRWRGHVDATEPLGDVDVHRDVEVAWYEGDVGRDRDGADAFDRPDPGCDLPPAGERAAHGRWREFLDDGLDRYAERRDLPGVDGTSQLSPHLRWGAIHPSRLLDDLRRRAPLGDDAHRRFVDEIGWREFYADVLHHHPSTTWENLDEKMDAMPVDDGDGARARFDAWREGRTGFPIVDAGMRQLLATGWMHNRVRMITASFLVKDLHLPWQWGAAHFMDHLVDGDMASNSHGWQWVAGTGTDAAPYFRVFNPTAQAERYDPDGSYVARWVPELAGDDHAGDDHDGDGVGDGAGERGAYPDPIVDHADERREALARYEVVREASSRR